jgi:hypothetical protein
MAVIFICIFIGFIAYYFVTELDALKFIQIKQQEEHTKTNQFLLSTIDWATKRQKLILFSRDVIFSERKNIKNFSTMPLEEAYVIAESNVSECEKYVNVSPIILLAMQRCESFFNKKARSPAGALGLNQIMPSTAKMLAAAMQLEYSDTLLFDIKYSDKLTVKYLDLLYATYLSTELVLADYNGGPRVAYYYKAKSELLPKETADYVPCVIDTWKTYEKLFEAYKVDSTFLNLDSTLRFKTIKK